MAHSWDGSSIRMTEGCTSIAPTPKWNAWTIPPLSRVHLSYEGSFWIRNASGSKRSAHADVPARAHTFAPRRYLPTRAAFSVVSSFRSLPPGRGKGTMGLSLSEHARLNRHPRPPSPVGRGNNGIPPAEVGTTGHLPHQKPPSPPPIEPFGGEGWHERIRPPQPETAVSPSHREGV